jgi:DNA-binding MarR family transcriptional regulator
MSGAGPYPPAELRAIAARLIHLADMAESTGEVLLSSGRVRPASALERDTPGLAALADSEYRARRDRDELFSGDLFGEPAWDMLLDLYVNRARGRRVSVTSLCIASSRPPTTALRWITLLLQHGLVFRHDSSADQRVSYIELTAQGAALMNKFLSHRIKSLSAALFLSEPISLNEG